MSCREYLLVACLSRLLFFLLAFGCALLTFWLENGL
jgi:hypothetical protein